MIPATQELKPISDRDRAFAVAVSAALWQLICAVQRYWLGEVAWKKLEK